MKHRTFILTIGLLFVVAVTKTTAVPVRYAIDDPPNANAGRFTIDIPSGDAAVPFTQIIATDIDGNADGSPWISVFYTRSNGLTLLSFITADASSSKSVGFSVAGSDLIDGWSAIVSELELQVVDGRQAVPDASATAVLLALGAGRLALMRRRLSA